MVIIVPLGIIGIIVLGLKYAFIDRPQEIQDALEANRRQQEAVARDQAYVETLTPDELAAYKRDKRRARRR